MVVLPFLKQWSRNNKGKAGEADGSARAIKIA